MYQGTHGHFDFANRVWHRAWNRPCRDEQRICEVFTMVRNQSVYRKLADDGAAIPVDHLVQISGVNVGRWMDRYDAAIQVLTNNLWIVYVERVPARSFGESRTFRSEQFLRNTSTQVNVKHAHLELGGRAHSLRVLPTAEQVICSLGEGVLA